ncbi:MAG: methylmalonyl Co-A mutase-associated GTPase MeaB [candidate division Zixibacteria bacterium HGW-Zixibacteria-1]|nr:MAG: methylmalonyl Co-A mutase-associated GTPase MeaB [candidate division Zixibacteria bacterium HGW-Zixibacteria-1]
MTVLDKFNQGDQAALAKIISFVEDYQDGYREVLGKLYPESGRATRIGFTGPPGAGKSSLVNNISKALASNGKKVAVIAVDPSSPFTGGALLGDRIRLTDMPTDGTIFIRSMATRGSSGGLAAATGNVATVLDAFGFDFILIETVGVGQIELDIVDACDTVIVVLVPESGDSIQTLKAGLMEIADIFVVNKADRPGAENIVMELNMTLDLKRDQMTWDIPVLSSEAINNKGTDILLEKMGLHMDYAIKSGWLEKHRRKQIRKKIYNILTYYVDNMIRSRLADMPDLEKAVSDIYTGQGDPYSACRELVKLSGLTINNF